MWSRAPRAITGSLALVLSFVLPVTSPAEAAPYVGADIVLDGSAFSAASADWTIDGTAVWSNVADEWAEYEVELTAGRWMVGIEAINEGSLGDDPFWYPFYELTVGPGGESLDVPASDSELQHGFVELDVPVDGAYTVRFTWLNDLAEGELPGGGFERDANIRIERVFFDATGDFAPETWIENPANGHVYGVTNSHESFVAAEDEAVGWGGHLVTVSDQAEQDWLYEQFGSVYHWIGLNDLDVEGSFVWVSGEPVVYTNWCQGEPNDYLGEDSVQMSSGSQCWNDIPAENGNVGIVEIESPPGVDPQFNVAYGGFPAVEPSDDFVHLYGWTPGSTLTVSIDDPVNGGGTDFEVTGIEVASTLGFNVQIGPDFNIETGHAVTVNDGTFSATHVVTGLVIMSADPDTEVVSGVATPGSDVVVGQYPFTETYSTTADVGDGSWQVEMSSHDLQLGDGVTAFEYDADGNTTQYGYTIPPSPQIRGSLTGDYIDGEGYAPASELAVSIDTGSGPVPVADPPTTDGEGRFWYQTAFRLESGFTIEVSGGAVARSLTLAGLTFDVLDVAADEASGTSDQPDGTEVFVNVGNETVWEDASTTVVGGEWSVAFSIDVTADMGAQAQIREPDGDATVADSPARPNIRATADRPQDRVEGYNFAPDTTVTLTVDTGEGLVAVADPPTTDEFGNFDYQGGDGFDLSSGDVVEVSDGTTTRTLTLVGLTFDVLDVEADEASGTSDQPDGTEVFVGVGNEAVGDEVIVTVEAGVWSAAFSIDLTADMGAQAQIREPDGDETIADPPARPNIRATADRPQDRVEGYNFAPDTTLTLTVDTGAGPVLVADPPTTDEWGNFWYDGGVGLDLASGDVVEVSDGTTTRTLTLVALTFDVLDLDADTASGTSDQPDGTEVFVGAGNDVTYEEVVATVESGQWSAAFSIDVTADMGAQAGIREPDGDATFADPAARPNIRATADRPQDRVEGDNFTPDTTVTLTVDSGAGPVAVPDPPTTDEWGNFDYQGGGVLDLVSGDVVEVSDGTTTRTLTVVGLTFDVLDLDADTASGTSDQPDGTGVFVGVGNEFVGEEFVATVEDGGWSATFSIDVTADMGAQAQIREPDGDETIADPPELPPVPQLEVYPEFDMVLVWDGDVEMSLSVERDGSEVYSASGVGGFQLWQDGFDLLAGDLVVVSDGETTKDHVVRSQTIDELLPAPDNRISGTAEPGSTVSIRYNTTQSGLSDDQIENATATADSNGDWAYDLATDVVAGTAIEVSQGDEPAVDNDATIVVAYLPAPTITARPPSSVEGYGWIEGVPVAIEVDGFVVDPVPVPERFGFPWDTSFGTELVDETSGETWTLEPGHTVTASDGDVIKTHVVVDVTFDELDADLDTATGTAPAGAEVDVYVGDDTVGTGATTIAEPDDAWSVDFVAEGFDVTAGMSGSAAVRDDDGDATFADLVRPRFNVMHDDDVIFLHGWLTDASVTVSIDDPANGAGADHETTVVARAEWQAVDLSSTFDIQPGHEVTVSDGLRSFTHVVTNLLITSVDEVTGLVEGVADPGRAVEISSRNQDDASYWVDPAPDGSWQVTMTADEVRFESGVTAHQYDVNGNATQDDFWLPHRHFKVHHGSEFIVFSGWEPGSTLTVTIDDPATGAGVDHEITDIAVPDEGDFDVEFAGVFDVNPGHEVTVSDGTTVLTHVVTELFITSADVDTDLVNGTASPGLTVVVLDWWDGEPTTEVSVDPAVDGTWLADLSAQDLRPGSRIEASQYEDLPGGSAGTGIFFRVPNPIIEVNPFVDTIRLPGWPLGATVTVEIDDDTDPANGVLHTDTAVIEEDTDEGSPQPTLGFIDVWPDVDLEAGLVVRATDGVIEREHVVTPLGVTSVDLDTDVMTGTANPYGPILVFASGEDDFGRRDTVADADGNWSVDFSAEPADPAEGYGVTDFAGQYWFVLGESDDDLDATVWHAPSASAGVGAMTDLDVITLDGTGLSPVTVTVESAIGEVLHETVVDVARSGLGAEFGGFVFPEWAFDPRESFPGALIDLSGIVDLVPGQTVTASDVAYTMQLEISAVTVDEVDTEADTVSGTVDESVDFVANILSEFAGFGVDAEFTGTSWTQTICDPELIESPAETCVPVDVTHDSVGLTLAGQADSDFDTFTNVFWHLLPEIDSLSVPAVVEAGETVEVDSTFTDLEVPDAHTAAIDWGDGTAVESVDVVAGTGPGSGGSVSGTHVYTTAGLFEVSVTVTDAAGDSDVASLFLSSVDTVAPVVSVVSPADGGFFGLDQPVVAEFECVDAGSGVASCVGDVAAGELVDTSTAGVLTFTVTAVDNVGNTTVVTHSYSVDVTTVLDDFEDGDVAGWVTSHPTLNGSIEAVATPVSPSGGSFVGEVIFDGSCYGPSSTFAPSMPDSVGWYFRADGDTGHASGLGAYLQGPEGGRITVVSYHQGALRYYGAGDYNEIVSASTGTWYLVELKNIDWVADTFDIWIDGVVQVTDAPFYQAADSVYRFHNYACPTATGPMYLDDITFGFDTTPPEVTVTTPADGAVYGLDQVVAAEFECADPGSGIASCTGDVAAGEPIDTSTAGEFTFTVTATDNVDNTTTVTHTYSVKEPPTAVDDDYTVPESQILEVAAPGLLANDSEPEGRALTAELVTDAAHGTTDLASDGSFTYEPDPGFVGSDAFTYDAVGPDGFRDTAAVTITVSAVNNAPVADDDAYSTDEDTLLGVAAPGVLDNDDDVDGDPLSAALTSAPSHGTLTLDPDGSFIYDPAPDFNGTDTFTYIATDGLLETAPATVTITVNNVAPTATFEVPESVVAGEDIVLSLSDPFDPSTADTTAGFEYAFDCGDGNGLSEFGAESSVTCATDTAGTRAVEGQIRDKDGGTSTYTATVEVVPANEPPELVGPGAQIGRIGDEVSVQVAAIDPDDDALIYGAAGLPDGLTIDTTTGLITGTLAATGEYTVTLSVSDGDLSDGATIAWTVTDVETGSSTLWAWGWNAAEQLGDSTAIDRWVPTRIGTDADWAVISADGYHTVAVKSDGSLWAWGDNREGQLGDGSLTDRAVPTQIGTDTDWATVTSGFNYTMALKMNGSLWAWGDNRDGQLGDGSLTDRAVPTQIGTDTDWATVTAGTFHTVAVKTDGTLWAWGDNFYGQLGNGTTIDRAVPTQIGTDTDWATVTAGGWYTVAVKTDGTLWAWGDNFLGALGDGTTTSRTVPTWIGVDADWATVTAGSHHTVAVKTDGTLWAWGWNAYGQLGGGGYTVTAPLRIGDDTDWAMVNAGADYTMAVKTGGTLWAWGRNYYGGLGDGTTTKRTVPTQIGADTDWYFVAAGSYHTVAIKTLPTLLADTDGDGIHDVVDGQPLVPSTAFGDGTGTFGEILANDTGETLTVSDLLDPDGVRITAGGTSGEARLRLCDSFEVTFPAGSEVTFTCGSLTVEVFAGGPVVVAPEGAETTVVAVPDGVRATISEPVGEVVTVQHLGGADPVVVTVDGEETPVPPVNDPPMGLEQFASTDEDTPVAVELVGFDPDSTELTYSVVTTPSHGTLAGTAPDLTYIPESDWNGTDAFTYTVSDGESESEPATVTISVLPVNDPPTATASSAAQTVQYSDPIATVTVEANDVDSATLTATASGLPDGLTLTGSPCSPPCALTLSGAVTDAVGTYSATITVDDGDGAVTVVAVTILVEPEDSTVPFDPDNTVAVRVDDDGGTGTVELSVAVHEATPDLPIDASAPGYIGLAEVSISLVPVGPGSPVEGECTAGAVIGTGYDAVLPVTCTFADVPVNAYTVVAAVDGGYYAGGAEDVVTVYDPTLGFTTGGGWFYWPGTADPDTGYLGDRTNFGYTMKYNKKATSVKGNLLMIRHLPDGSIYRIKSNALDGLALGQDPSVPMGWATFSGKATYLDPTMIEPEGNNTFIVYVEDRDEPGTGVDRFWIEVHDKTGEVIAESSLPRDAADHAIDLGGGNIVAPHAASGTRPPRVR